MVHRCQHTTLGSLFTKEAIRRVSWQSSFEYTVITTDLDYFINESADRFSYP